MSPAKPALEEVAGYLGVGSLQLLGWFFIIDGAANFVPFIEPIFKTTTWTLLATVPLLVVSYVLGLLSSPGAERLANRVKQPPLTPDLFASVSTSGSEMLVQRYADVERHARLLYGCTVSFVVLALGPPRRA